MYSPLWKITHQSPSVLCTPPFEKSRFLEATISGGGGHYLGGGYQFGKYGSLKLFSGKNSHKFSQDKTGGASFLSG